ncbi:MAG: NAD+ synthase [Candidatus Omnitrophota bacterium]
MPLSSKKHNRKRRDNAVKKAKGKIVRWIKAKMKLAGAKGLVFGLSGGIDSAAVAALAKQAAGKNALALILPCHSSVKDVKDAMRVARALGVKTNTINLCRIYDALIKVLPKAARLAQGNLKPRLRMLILYYFANKLNYLVAGTGNKSEISVGYFTKYGDGGVDILPIGNLYKYQVRALAEELGIPKDIIYRPPTAGLWHGQTDEGEMGITYKRLDRILAALERGKKIGTKTEMKIIEKRIRQGRHKNAMPEICKA